MGKTKKSLTEANKTLNDFQALSDLELKENLSDLDEMKKPDEFTKRFENNSRQGIRCCLRILRSHLRKPTYT